MTWLIQTIKSSLERRRGSALAAEQPMSRSSMTRWATAAVRAASASTSALEQVREVGADHQRERQDRDDRREHERQEQLAIEARADLAKQRPPDTRPLTGDPGEEAGPDQHEPEHAPPNVVSSARWTK